MEIEFTYRDLTKEFMTLLPPKHYVPRKETTNCINKTWHFQNFCHLPKLQKKELTWLAKDFQNFHQVYINYEPIVSQQAGLFNDQDYKLNNILTLVKEDIDWIQAQMNALKSEVNNKLNQSIYEYLQAQMLRSSNTFKKVLEAHTQKMKQQEERRTRIGGERDRLIKRGGGFSQKYQRLHEESNKNSENDNHTIEMQMQMKENEQKLSSIRKIEQMLNDVTTVFQKVGTMVRLQETMIDRIDKYTDDSLSNVQKGRKELQEAHKRLSQNRGFILKIFLILFIFSFIYIVFIL